MPTAPTTASRARSIINRCLTWGILLVTVGYAGQALVQTLVADLLPIGFGIVVASLVALFKIAGPAVLAVGIVGIGVQLGLAAYGVRPTLPSDERSP